ncbi:rhodanese-like domain-containing protein [Luteococcus sanguinis]|uniref:Rhodanese-like domain-containing protein n=1 Tax=Luteococcus sanguinis TaxID=174038 RepID=A0ABW1WYZ6_9ACTN
MSRQPGQPLARPVSALVATANEKVTSLDADQVEALIEDENTCIVDIRDVRELERDGTIPGAIHAPRGMLEFWVDPESPYYQPRLDDGRRLVLFCGGGWRSALSAAALVDMGREDVAHLDGGFGAWRDAGKPIAPHEKKR